MNLNDCNRKKHEARSRQSVAQDRACSRLLNSGKLNNLFAKIEECESREPNLGLRGGRTEPKSRTGWR